MTVLSRPAVAPLRRTCKGSVVTAHRTLRRPLSHKGGFTRNTGGDWRPNRAVIIEFPDIASIKNWYRAPEYQPLIALRRSAAIDVMIWPLFGHGAMSDLGPLCAPKRLRPSLQIYGFTS
jgi:uncharacterized protein (DUF1330 family)